MSLTASEIESLRAIMSYGNIALGGHPYTPDGWLEVFSGVVAPNISTDTETSATTLVAPGVVTVTPLVMTNIVVAAQVIVDVGEDAEIVMVKATTPTAFTARFARAHATTGYPIAVMSGKARLRYLMAKADALWEKTKGSSISQTAGLKQLGQGEIEWFSGGKGVLDDVMYQYVAVVRDIADLIRVPIGPGSGAAGGRGSLEAY